MSVRTYAYPVVALAVVAGLVFLRPSRDRGPEPTPERERASPARAGFRLEFKLDFPQPPHPVIQGGLVAERWQRWFDRLLWAPTRQVIYTQNLIAERLDEREQRLFLDLVRQEWSRDANRAAVFIPCLGAFDLPEAQDLILEAARHPNNRVRGEAARALTLLDTPEAARQARALLDDPFEMVRRYAERALTEMDNPAAEEELQRYAATNPDEAILHVLHRLAKRADDPKDIPVLRQHLDRTDEGRVYALEGLTRFGDYNALERLHEYLMQPDIVEQSRALKLLPLAPPETIEVEWLEPFLTHSQPQMRGLVTGILTILVTAEGARNRDRAIEFLLRQAGDADNEVRNAAIAGLFKAGRKEVAEPYLKGIASASGLSLHTSVDVSCRLLEDERAQRLLLERLERSPSPEDTAIVLGGLGHLKQVSSVEPLIGFIRAASPDEPCDGHGWPLSQIAVQQITGLGRPAVDALFGVLAEDVHEQAWLRAIDALCGAGGPEDQARMIAVVLERTRPEVVRMAALESLSWWRSPALFDELEAVLPQLESRDLAQKALLVLFDYA